MDIPPRKLNAFARPSNKNADEKSLDDRAYSTFLIRSSVIPSKRCGDEVCAGGERTRLSRALYRGVKYPAIDYRHEAGTTTVARCVR